MRSDVITFQVNFPASRELFIEDYIKLMMMFKKLTKKRR